MYAPVNLGVHPDDAPGHKGVLVQLAFGQLGVQGLHKVPPNQGLILDFRRLAGGDFREVHHVEVLVDECLAHILSLLSLVKHVEGVEVLVLRVDAIGREAAAQAVGAVVHQGDGADDVLAAAALAAFGKDGGYRAPRGDAGAVQAFSQHVPNLPFSAGRSLPGPRPAFSHAIPLPGKCRTPLAALHLPEKRGNEKNARAPQDTQIPWAQTPLSVWRIIIRTCALSTGFCNLP